MFTLIPPSGYHKLTCFTSLHHSFHLQRIQYRNLSNNSHQSNFQYYSFSREKGSSNLKTEVQLPSVFLNINFLKEIDLELFLAKLITHLFSFVKYPLFLAVCAGSLVQPAVDGGISLQ